MTFILGLALGYFFSDLIVVVIKAIILVGDDLWTDLSFALWTRKQQHSADKS